jgi:uncharacterized protein YhaN
VDAVEAVTATLNRLVAEADCTDEAELADAVQRSDELRAARERIDELDRELALQSDGRTPSGLEEALDGRDEATLQSAEAVAGSEHERLADQLTELRDQLTTLRNERDAHDGTSAAAEISQQIQRAVSQATEDTEAYLGLALASLVLREQMTTFAADKQRPILDRARPWFNRMTCGMFPDLDTDAGDDGTIVLEGIRPGGERVGVDAMSDGTRDQLYLALRLAALAEAATTTEPLPLVLDDLLITFDDDRASATLEVLGELSDTVQVLLFSHHQHLAELATDALGERCIHHRLEARALPDAAR